MAQAGRFDEGLPHAERAIRLAREHHAPENLLWALGNMGWRAYLARGLSRLPVPDLRRACMESVEIAKVVGTEYQPIYASRLLAIAHFMYGDYEASYELLSEVSMRAREAGTALDWHGIHLAVFSDTCLALGDVQAAIRRAREGIAFADTAGQWFQAAIARAALADALIHADAPEREIRTVIAEARELVQRSSGNSLLPRLRETQARLDGRRDATLLTAGLREAEALYRAQGAPDPADRIARELGA